MEQGDLFARLPLELLEAIAGHLDLHDACNLRLTNSSMAAKIARAKTFFLDKTTKIDSSRDIRRLVEMTEHGRIGNSLRNLTITGTVTENHPTVQRATIGKTTITLLSQAFSNIQRHSFHGRLGSLALNVDAPVPASRMAPNLGIPD